MRARKAVLIVLGMFVFRRTSYGGFLTSPQTAQKLGPRRGRMKEK